MRWVIARVLPVPAPARMQTGPAGAVTAARCSSSRLTRTRPAPVDAFSTTAGIMAARPDVHRTVSTTTLKRIPPNAHDLLDVLVRVLSPAHVAARPREHRIHNRGHRA